MRIKIQHEIKGRIRFSTQKKKMTAREADMLLFYINSLKNVTSAKVYERTGDSVVCYTGSRQELIKNLVAFSFEDKELQEKVPENTGRELMNQYKEKLVSKLVVHFLCKIILPAPAAKAKAVIQSLHFIKEGLKCIRRRKLEVPVLDATAISVSLIRGDVSTASSIMLLLGVGEILEEWTHKKSVADLARSMSLNVEKVWKKEGEAELLTEIHDIKEQDLICVHMGNMIPLDGIVTQDEAMVNQASLTGEGIPVKKEKGAYVYAGTVVEEGELTVQVKQSAGSTRYEKIVSMIEDSERLKSSLEGKAAHLAAMRECQDHQITVKGGKFLEAVAEAETVVFDKTGTFTKAQPTVADVVTFGGKDRNSMLRLAACLEEHFPHSIANAVVAQAKKEGLAHEEMHSKVEYVVAHGISSQVNGEKAIIGSYHFVFEDEKTRIPEGESQKFEELPPEYSHLYLAVSGELAAAICIEDPLREEAKDIVSDLKKAGIRKVVMMTGDSERTARTIAEKTGVDQFYAEVLPEDKASYIEKEKAKGRKVLMVGDGINDSPALSAANAGVAVSGGAQIAREIADITISGENLHQLVTLKRAGNCLMKRIHRNYRFVIGFNTGLIILGLAGILAPGTSAFLHNTSTLAITQESMTNMLDKEKANNRKGKR